MSRRVALFLTVALAVAPLLGCSRSPSHKAALSANYFPLGPNSIWTYQINSKSQRANYLVTDRVVGRRYVRSLNMTGDIVEETYGMSRGGPRPIIYYLKDGYWARLSALSYSNQRIQAPTWGRSEEDRFLPQSLVPDLSWNNTIFPFGHMPGSFDIAQAHHASLEKGEVAVPAGHFERCIKIDTQARYEGGSYGKAGMGLKLAYIDWYAPNVGLVKTLALEGGPNGREMERVELVSYQIKQASPSSASKTQP